MIKKAFILNYNCGNIKSVLKALQHCDYQVSVGLDEKPSKDSLLVIPGVGHFGSAMSIISNSKAETNIKNHFENNGKILGICLGMQLLFGSSEEAPNVKGLGLIKGKVKKLRNVIDDYQHSFHLGWSITSNLKNKEKHDMYYVHQYFCEPECEDYISETFKWKNKKLCAGIRANNLRGLQFHPEKSSSSGLKLLMNL
tara:strand:+ start:902 stop:1492 length:591 start_codon:yes stop_codon:yes gene_type:complete